MRRLLFFLLPLLLICANIRAGAPILGAMGNDARLANNRIDIASTITALRELGANTYFYLIWQDEHDWDDLPAFADEAAKHGITVWVYIVPWSETPPHRKHGWGFSEPLRNDYITWAKQIAQLSLSHPNIAGYVIDDFFDNTLEPDHFSPPYVREMTAAGRIVNPRIRFYPLMYPQTPWGEFLDRYGGMIDGVVVCYPYSESAVRNVLTYTNDQRHGPSVLLELPRKHGENTGDGAVAECDVSVFDPRRAELSFYFDCTDMTDDPGDEIARLRVNGTTVWERPTNAQPRDGVVDLDLSRYMRGQRHVRLQFSILAMRGGVPENMKVSARFDDIRMYGMGSPASQYEPGTAWRTGIREKFLAPVVEPSAGAGQRRLPVILMPSGESAEFTKRYDVPATPQTIAGKFRMCLELAQEGLVQGVVGYRIPLTAGDANFKAIRREFLHDATAGSARRDKPPETDSAIR